MKIGIFDSGIGGLTVLKELIKHKPNNHYIYIGDTLNMPYGNKSIKDLEICASRIIEYFIKNDVDLIIIACGTVSSTLYNKLKNKYSIPLLDIINPTVDFVNKSDYKAIGVIGTKNTINSKVFDNKIKDKKVYTTACPKLATMIEKNDSKTEDYLNKKLKYFDNKNIDLLILGCTHYPIVDNLINNKSYKLLNMANPILELVSDGKDKKVEIYFTKLDENIIRNTNEILKIETEIVNINVH